MSRFITVWIIRKPFPCLLYLWLLFEHKRKNKNMTKILILLVAACLVYGIAAQSTCLNECGSGCFIDTVSQRCRDCPTACASCRDPDTCLACTTEYFLNEEKNCVSCNVTNCANCTSQGVCTACQSGYF